MNKARKIIRKKLVDPILEFLKQGMTPNKLALGVTLGVSIGLIPVIGITTLICILLAIPLRINMAVIQTVNYFVYPLQILLIIPLIEFGSFLLSINPITYSVEEIIEIVNTSFITALDKLWMAALAGTFAWLIIILPASVMLYFILKKTFSRIITEKEDPTPVPVSS